jgi:hypothetical protein
MRQRRVLGTRKRLVVGAVAVACLGASLALLASCGEEKHKGSDQLDSCGDVPHEGFGHKVEMETLVCGNRVMKSEFDACCGPFDELTGLMVQSEEELTAILESMTSFSTWKPATEPCEVDFAVASVLVTGTTLPTAGCGGISICGVYDDGEKLTATVYFDDCVGMELDIQSPYHFVQIPATSKPVEFKYYAYQHTM